MTAIDLGTAAPVSWRTTTAHTVTLLVTRPDATTQSPTVTESSGTYSATVSTPQAGRYLLKWTDSTATAINTDILDVWPADPRFIISTAEMQSGLQITGYTPSAADVSDMRLFIAAATPVIEDMVGAVLVRTETQKSNGGKSGVALWEQPDTITSVTVGDTVLVADDDYVVDENAGIVYAGSSTAPSVFPDGRMNVTITYTVGASRIEPNIRQATIDLCVHNWQYGRQADHAVLPQGVDMVQTPGGHYVPTRVYELCKPNLRADGVG